MEVETFFISLFGRKDMGTGVLRNLTDGGENPPNWKGKKRSEHHALAMSKSRTGVKQPKIALSKLGNTYGRFNRGNRGMHSWSPEDRQRISEQSRAWHATHKQPKRERSEAERLRHKEFMLNLWKTNPGWRNYVPTEEAKAKMRVAGQANREKNRQRAKLWWENKKKAAAL